MQLQDALLNWLQIQLVLETRPDDEAAADTVAFFETALLEDHKVCEIMITDRDEAAVHMTYMTAGKTHETKFDRERAEQLVDAIRREPKYGI